MDKVSMVEYLNQTWNGLKCRKDYIPKLSKKPLISCKGCANLQLLITSSGCGNVRFGVGNSSMFFDRDGKVYCFLGYEVKGYYSKDDPVPLECCPKPKTRRHLTICKDLIFRGYL